MDKNHVDKKLLDKWFLDKMTLDKMLLDEMCLDEWTICYKIHNVIFKKIVIICFWRIFVDLS